MLQTLVIIGANGLYGLVLYVLGWHRGAKAAKTAPDFTETRACLCKHAIVAHKLHAKGSRGVCTCINKSTKDKYGNFMMCACEGYVPDPKESYI